MALKNNTHNQREPLILDCWPRRVRLPTIPAQMRFGTLRSLCCGWRLPAMKLQEHWSFRTTKRGFGPLSSGLLLALSFQLSNIMCECDSASQKSHEIELSAPRSVANARAWCRAMPSPNCTDKRKKLTQRMHMISRNTLNTYKFLCLRRTLLGNASKFDVDSMGRTTPIQKTHKRMQRPPRIKTVIKPNICWKNLFCSQS